MIVKHNHNCMFCNHQKTCFVFSDFAQLLSICRSCYDTFVEEYSSWPELADESCEFCEQTTICKRIDGFDDNTFFTDQHICERCAQRIVDEISVHDV